MVKAQWVRTYTVPPEDLSSVCSTQIRCAQQPTTPASGLVSHPYAHGIYSHRHSYIDLKGKKSKGMR